MEMTVHKVRCAWLMKELTIVTFRKEKIKPVEFPFKGKEIQKFFQK